MSSPSQRLSELGITLLAPARPVGSYVPAIRAGELIISSGQLPVVDGQLTVTGRVGDDVSLEEAATAARTAAINALAAVAEVAGGVDNIKQIIRVNVFVASSENFYDQAKVANGASDLLAEIFGESGRHTRCAIGASVLPLNSCVEVDITATATATGVAAN